MQGSQAREPENTDPPRQIALWFSLCSIEVCRLRVRALGELGDGRRGVVSTARSETMHCLNLNQWNPVAGKRNKLPPCV